MLYFLIRTWGVTDKSLKNTHSNKEKEKKKLYKTSLLANLGKKQKYKNSKNHEIRTEIKQDWHQTESVMGVKSRDRDRDRIWHVMRIVADLQKQQQKRTSLKRRVYIGTLRLCPSIHSRKGRSGKSRVGGKKPPKFSLVWRKAEDLWQHREAHPGAICKKDFLWGRNLESTLALLPGPPANSWLWRIQRIKVQGIKR